MKEVIVKCPICGKIVSLEKGFRTQVIEPVNGICWDEFGYSLGGWGQRRNFMSKFTGEICNECFYAIKPKIDELIETINKRKIVVKKGYVFTKHPRTQQVGIKCMECKMTSYNENDIKNLYCGYCHIFHKS